MDITKALDERLSLHRDEMTRAVADVIKGYPSKAELEKRLQQHAKDMIQAVAAEVKAERAAYRAEFAKAVAAEVKELIRLQLPAELLEVVANVMKRQEEAAKSVVDSATQQVERHESMLKTVIEEVRKTQAMQVTVQPPLVKRVIERDRENNIIAIREEPV